MQTKLNELDTLQKVYYLQEMYDNYIIYEVASRGEGGMGGLFKQSYRMTDNEDVEFTGDPVEVRKEVNYVAMTTVTNLNMGGTVMDKNTKTPCCPGKVTLLLQGKGSPFQEQDRAWLETLEEPQIDKLVAMSQTQVVDEPRAMTREEAVVVLQEQLAEPSKFMKLLPPDVREQIQHGMALHKAEKDRLITHIAAHSNRYSAEKLASKTIEELQDLVSLIPDAVDYTVNGIVDNAASQSEDNLLLPPGIGAKA
jgi:hypothetical protein